MIKYNACLFVCFASQQSSIININNVNTFAINIFVTMTSFPPSATKTRTNNDNRDILTDGQLWPKQPTALANETHDHDDWGSATTTPWQSDVIISSNNTISNAIRGLSMKKHEKNYRLCVQKFPRANTVLKQIHTQDQPCQRHQLDQLLYISRATRMWDWYIILMGRGSLSMG